MICIYLWKIKKQDLENTRKRKVEGLMLRTKANGMKMVKNQQSIFVI